MPTRRADFEFVTVFGADIDLVISTISAVISSNPIARDDPAPLIRLLRHERGALVFTARVWCSSADFLTMTFDINEAVKKAFDTAGIAVPTVPVAKVV